MVRQTKKSQKNKRGTARSKQKIETNKALSHRMRDSQERSVDASADKSYAVFQVGKEKFCIDLDMIHEIITSFSLHSAAHLPRVFSGIINLRGESMPVVDLNRLMHEGDRTEEARTCLIVSIDSSRVGFLVDSDVEMVTAKKGLFHPLPDCYDEEESELLDGIFWAGGEFIGILRPQEVVRVIAKRGEGDEKL